ncbi:MAG: phosphatidylserine decarboxylase family protein [Pseudomonadota bacterium]
MDSTITAYRPSPRQSYIAREGYPFIAIAIAAVLLLRATGCFAAWIFMLGVAGFVAFFFRNPERVPPDEAGLVIAPADGRILSVTEGVVAPCTGRESTKVSIFMSVLNVHINRFPVAAKVKRVAYSAGRFLVASLDKASEANERNALVLEDESGRELVMVQIAGLVARRIVCYVREGDFRARGERFGLIRFGSRVDIYLPPGAKIGVRPGDRVKSGESVIGRFA